MAAVQALRKKQALCRGLCQGQGHPNRPLKNGTMKTKSACSILTNPASAPRPPCLTPGNPKAGRWKSPVSIASASMSWGLFPGTAGLFFPPLKGSVKTEQVAGGLRPVCRHTMATATPSIKKPCVVIIDNASMHTSRAFLARRDDWMAQGCRVALSAAL